MIVYINGKYAEESEANISVFDQGFLYGDGVYETMRTYRGRLWRADRHMERLSVSLRVAGFSLPYDAARLIDQIKMLIRKNEYKEARVRVMVTRGMSESRGARFLPAQESGAKSRGRGTGSTVLITCYPLPVFTGKEKLPRVKVDFFPVERAFPTVKTTSLFPLVMARRFALQNGLFDTLLMDRDGYVTEGAVSNLFVVRKGVLYTPRRGVLPGVTREAVLQIARKLVRKKILKKIVYGFFKRGFVLRADEVFLTNAPTGIASVAKIGGVAIGGGTGSGDARGGKVTRAVFEAFQAEI